jgi:excisionase family DNA binding protein
MLLRRQRSEGGPDHDLAGVGSYLQDLVGVSGCSGALLLCHTSPVPDVCGQHAMIVQTVCRWSPSRICVVCGAERARGVEAVLDAIGMEGYVGVVSNLEQAVAVTAVADAIGAKRRHSAQPRRRSSERLMSVDEAAQALGIARSSLYRELGAGRLPSVKIGRRRLVPASAITRRIVSAGIRPEAS